MNDTIDDTIEPFIKIYLSQMDSALKISEVLAGHSNSDEITTDHLIAGLVYRLMTPMNDKDMNDSLNSAQKIIDKLKEPESEEEYDQIEECYESVDYGSRKVKHPQCNCKICMGTRISLLNYHNHDCPDILSQRFKDAIEATCNKHKIFI